MEIYNAAAKSIFRPDGQDANTFRLQLESLADGILQGKPLINANLDDGIAVVKTMVAISHSARQGGDWVGVGDVEGDLEHSFLKRSELTHASPLAYHNQKESQRSGHHSRLTNGSDALQPD